MNNKTKEMDFKKKQKERPIGYNSNGAIYPKNKVQMESKKQIRKWVKKELSEGRTQAAKDLLEDRIALTLNINQCVDLIQKRTTSQQQTIERLREQLGSIIENYKKSESEDFSTRYVAYVELRLDIERAEQLLNTTEPIDQ